MKAMSEGSIEGEEDGHCKKMLKARARKCLKLTSYIYWRNIEFIK